MIKSNLTLEQRNTGIDTLQPHLEKFNMRSTMRLTDNGCTFRIAKLGQVEQWRLEAVREQLKAQGILLMYMVTPDTSDSMWIHIFFLAD